MSKTIKPTAEQLKEYQEEFWNSLKSLKLTDGKISFTKTIKDTNEKATLFFAPIAWRKMKALVDGFDKEVAWHGVAYRVENEENKCEYCIEDILVYPQKVTGATVNTDQEKYEAWLMQHDDDIFNNIRMQGHSHVNMSTSPSSVDETHQSKILDQLEDDMFYIFLIWNKSDSKFIRIYDLAKNTLFETKDVTVEVLDDGSGLEEFMKTAKELVDTSSSYIYSSSSGWTQKKDDSSQEKDKAKGEPKAKEDSSGYRKGKRRDAKDDDAKHYEYGGYGYYSPYNGYCW